MLPVREVVERLCEELVEQRLPYARRPVDRHDERPLRVPLREVRAHRDEDLLDRGLLSHEVVLQVLLEAAAGSVDVLARRACRGAEGHDLEQ